MTNREAMSENNEGSEMIILKAIIRNVLTPINKTYILLLVIYQSLLTFVIGLHWYHFIGLAVIVYQLRLWIYGSQQLARQLRWIEDNYGRHPLILPVILFLLGCCRLIVIDDGLEHHLMRFYVNTWPGLIILKLIVNLGTK